MALSFFNYLSFFNFLEISIQSPVIYELTTHVPASTAKQSVSVVCVRARTSFNDFNETSIFKHFLQTDSKHQWKTGTEGI